MGSEEIKSKSFRDEIIEFTNSKWFSLSMDFFRILLLLFIILTFFELVSNINIVKSMMNDPCRLCENLTGGTCAKIVDNNYQSNPFYRINISDLNVTIYHPSENSTILN